MKTNFMQDSLMKTKFIPDSLIETKFIPDSLIETKFILDSLLVASPLHDGMLKSNDLWPDVTKRDNILSDVTKERLAFNESVKRSLIDFTKTDMNYDISSSSNLLNYKYSQSIEIANKVRVEKEAEKLRRHNEKIALGKEQIIIAKKHSYYLEELLKDSRNAVEQRNAIIRFMVESMVASEQPRDNKKKFLMDLLVPIATVSSGASDLIQLVNDALESIS
ncbi:hypothetical protein [Exiguobacterium artemiae]